MGAAVATVIGNVIGAGYYIGYFLKGNSVLSVNIRDVTPKEKVMTSVLAIGVPASLGSIFMSVSQIVTNARLASYADYELFIWNILCAFFSGTGGNSRHKQVLWTEMFNDFH